MNNINNFNRSYFEELSMKSIISEIKEKGEIKRGLTLLISEYDILNNRLVRDNLNLNIMVMEMVKRITFLPDNMYLTKEMLALYYKVNTDTIDIILKQHEQELIDNGLVQLSGEELDKYITLYNLDDSIIPKECKSVYLFDRKVTLTIGLLLKNSIIAKHIREIILNTDDCKTYSRKNVEMLKLLILEYQQLIDKYKKEGCCITKIMNSVDIKRKYILEYKIKTMNEELEYRHKLERFMDIFNQEYRKDIMKEINRMID